MQQNIQAIHTNNAPKPIGIYSQATKATSACKNIIFISGQIPSDPQTNELITHSFTAEVTQVFENIQAICIASGGSLRDVIKLTLYLTDLANFATVNNIMEQYFHMPYPARATVEVQGLPRGVAFEAEAIMVLT